jgi:hypothetical protein
MTASATPFPDSVLFFIAMGYIYIPASALPITTDVLPEPYNSYQELFPRNATTDLSPSVASNHSLSTILPPIIFGVFRGVFTVGCFTVAIKQYRRSDTSRLEGLIMRTCTNFFSRYERFKLIIFCSICTTQRQIRVPHASRSASRTGIAWSWYTTTNSNTGCKYTTGSIPYTGSCYNHRGLWSILVYASQHLSRLFSCPRWKVLHLSDLIHVIILRQLGSRIRNYVGISWVSCRAVA